MPSLHMSICTDGLLQIRISWSLLKGYHTYSGLHGKSKASMMHRNCYDEVSTRAFHSFLAYHCDKLEELATVELLALEELPDRIRYLQHHDPFPFTMTQ